MTPASGRIAGYSGKPLVTKLGMKPGQRCSWMQAPEHYAGLLGKLPDGVEALGPRAADLDMLHLFVRDQRSLTREFPKAKRRIKPNGSLWVSWPKLSSKLKSDLTENVVREVGLANGLVDVKVAAIDDDWSGLRFMYRLKDRPVTKGKAGA